MTTLALPTPDRAERLSPEAAAEPTTGLVSAELRRNAWRIGLSYLLFNGENLLRLAQPLMLGWAVDDLLASGWHGLTAFAACSLLATGAGVWRRRYDTRVYCDLYAGIMVGTIAEQKRRGTSDAQLIGRCSLGRQIVEMFEHTLPAALQTGYMLLGGLAMLCWYDLRLALLGLAVLPLAAGAAYHHGRRVRTWNVLVHDAVERQADAVSAGDVGELERHFRELSRSRVGLSDVIAGSHGTMSLLTLALTATAVALCCRDTDPQTTGDLFAVVRLVWMFGIGLEQLAPLLDLTTRFLDVLRRFRT